MKVYIDVILFINIFFDFLLLLSVSLILRRNAKLYRIILGSLMGGLSILFLFLNIGSDTKYSYNYRCECVLWQQINNDSNTK